MNRNQDIKEMVKSAGLKLWQIAEAYGIPDYALSRKLRYELTPQDRTRIVNIIHELTSAPQGE